MVCITFVEHNGTSHRVEVEPGMTLMEAAYWNNIRAIRASCGGDGGCATCHVYVDRRWAALTGERSAREKSTLRFALEKNEDSRLACYIKITKDMDNLAVRIPERQF